jgi:hypothetical protein
MNEMQHASLYARAVLQQQQITTVEPSISKIGRKLNLLSLIINKLSGNFNNILYDL